MAPPTPYYSAPVPAATHHPTAVFRAFLPDSFETANHGTELIAPVFCNKDRLSHPHDHPPPPPHPSLQLNTPLSSGRCHGYRSSQFGTW